jgi:hypothetical protein
VEGLLTCPVFIPVLYHCLVEGFSAGGITVKSVVLLVFLLGVSIYGRIVPQSTLTEIKP